jgi:alpha 1,3-glucosidase
VDTKRREPYLLDQPYKGMVKDILRLRYAMLPIWYTAFRETSVTGLPVLRYVSQYHKVIAKGVEANDPAGPNS